LSTVSHELRTPLNAILGYAQLLLRTEHDRDEQESLTIIERNAKAQAQIIEDLLDMSRIISGKVRLDTASLDITQVVRAAIDTVRPTAEAKGVIIDAVQIAVGFSRYERGFTYRTPEQLKEWQQDTLLHIRAAERYAEAEYWPMNDKACNNYGGCVFRGICSKDPSVRPAFLESNFVSRPWNPLQPR